MHAGIQTKYTPLFEHYLSFCSQLDPLSFYILLLVLFSPFHSFFFHLHHSPSGFCFRYLYLPSFLLLISSLFSWYTLWMAVVWILCVPLHTACPTLTKGSNRQITQIWESDVFRLDLAYSILPFRVWSKKIHPAEKYLSQDIMILHWCQCTCQTHFAHLREIKCHFQELLPFVRVRQYSDK